MKSRGRDLILLSLFCCLQERHFMTFFGLVVFASTSLFSRGISQVVVVWEGIHSRSDTNRTEAEGLSFYYPRLLYCPDQMLTVMMSSQHQISSSKIIKSRAPM